MCRRSEFSGLGITSKLESSAQVRAVPLGRSAGRMPNVFAQRKVLEVAAADRAQPGKAAEAAVTAHGGQRALEPVAVAISCAAADVSSWEGESEPRRPGAVRAPRGAGRLCG